MDMNTAPPRMVPVIAVSLDPLSPASCTISMLPGLWLPVALLDRITRLASALYA